jgi:hypothetical protein
MLRRDVNISQTLLENIAVLYRTATGEAEGPSHDIHCDIRAVDTGCAELGLKPIRQDCPSYNHRVGALIHSDRQGLRGRQLSFRLAEHVLNRRSAGEIAGRAT